VRIKQGPLKERKGACGKERPALFVVNVNILGRSIGMKIDAEDIERRERQWSRRTMMLSP